MSTSIPHRIGLRLMPDDRARVQHDDLLDLLRTVCGALDVPYGAAYQGLRDARTRAVHNALRNVLDDADGVWLDISGETQQLRQDLADDNPRLNVAAARGELCSLPRARWLRFLPGGGGRHA